MRSRRGRSAAQPTRAGGSNPFRLVLMALIVITVSRFHQHFPALTAARPALLLAVGAAGFAMLNPRAIQIKNWTREWPMRLVIGLAILACFSVLFGISQGRAGKFFLESYSKVLISAFLVAGAIRVAKDLKQFVWAFVIGSGILSFLALFVFKPEPTQTGLVRLGHGYTYDANDIGCVLAVGLPLTLLTLQTSRTRGKILSVLILVATGMTFAISGSRGGFVGLVAICGWLLIMLREVSVLKRVGFILVVGIALAVKAPEGYWKQMQTITKPTADYNWSSKDGRKQVALRGLQYAMDYPVFGIGVSNFPMAEGTISEKARRHVVGTGIRWTAAHNTHVEVTAEMGFPGLVLWVFLLGGGVVSMVRLRSRLPRGWARGNEDQRFVYWSTVYLPVAVLGFAVTATFVSFAYADPVYLLAAYLTGVQASARALGVGARAAVVAPGGRRARAGRRAGLGPAQGIPSTL